MSDFATVLLPAGIGSFAGFAVAAERGDSVSAVSAPGAGADGWDASAVWAAAGWLAAVLAGADAVAGWVVAAVGCGLALACVDIAVAAAVLPGVAGASSPSSAGVAAGVAGGVTVAVAVAVGAVDAAGVDVPAIIGFACGASVRGMALGGGVSAAVSAVAVALSTGKLGVFAVCAAVGAGDLAAMDGLAGIVAVVADGSGRMAFWLGSPSHVSVAAEAVGAAAVGAALVCVAVGAALLGAGIVVPELPAVGAKPPLGKIAGVAAAALLPASDWAISAANCGSRVSADGLPLGGKILPLRAGWLGDRLVPAAAAAGAAWPAGRVVGIGVSPAAGPWSWVSRLCRKGGVPSGAAVPLARAAPPLGSVCGVCRGKLRLSRPMAGSSR